MNKTRPGTLRWTWRLAGFALLCGTWLAFAGTAGSPNDPNARIADLRAIVLSHPADSATREKLVELQGQEQQQRQEALGWLISGLKYYTDGQSRQFQDAMKKAEQVPYVADLARSYLPSLPEMMTKGARQAAAAPSARCKACDTSGWAACEMCDGIGFATVCPRCGGTGRIGAGRGSRSICPVCKGRGRLPSTACPDCGGRGKTANGLICGTCDGWGAVICEKCQGEGFTRCTECSSKVVKTIARAQGPELAQVERLMALAEYLRSGGIDYLTPNGRSCSPRPAKNPQP
jgi:hypothetical protein